MTPKRTSNVPRCLLPLVATLTLSVAGHGAPAMAAEPPTDPKDDLATKWRVNDADPKSSIPPLAERNKDPLEFAYFLQDLAARAERATRESRWQDSVRYYEALGHAVPDAGISFSRLCLAYAKLGQYAIAAGNCGKAVALPMAKVIDHLRFIDNTLKSERFGERDVANVEASLKHLRQHLALHPQPTPGASADHATAPPPKVADEAQPAAEMPKKKRTREELIAAILERQKRKLAEALSGQGDATKADGPTIHVPTEVALLESRFAIKQNDAARLARSIDELRALAVDEKQLLALSWAHALLAKDEARADDLLARAKSLGLPDATVATMKAQQERHFPSGFLPKERWPLVVLGLLAVVAAAVLVRLRRRSLGASPA